MKLITKRLPVNHNIFHFGDVHEGTILFHEKGFNTFMDMIESEYDGCSNNYAIHYGDGVEGITIDDKRYDPGIQTKDDLIPDMIRQCRAHIERIRPIKDKILFMLESNHPEKLWRFIKVTPFMCNDLNIEYGTWTTKLIVKDNRGRLQYKSYHTHGRKVINSSAGNAKDREESMKRILRRQLEDQAGDCILMAKAHAHKLLINDPFSRLYMTDDGIEEKQAYTQSDHTADWIDPDHRWYICTGSFLKTRAIGVSGYAEKAEYKPNELGFVISRVRDRKIVGIDKVVV